MRLIVCGGRDFFDAGKLFPALDALDRKHGLTLIIHGNAEGADTLAQSYAANRRIPTHPERADWKTHGKAAGPIRNAKMLTLAPDGLLAMPGGRGTADMVRQAEAAGVPVWRPYG